MTRQQKATALKPEDIQLVRSRATRVDRNLRSQFEAAYAAWRQTWSQPLIALSSAPAARGESAEFRMLLDLGSGILPLLMDKLTEPDEFFALVAVDDLLAPNLRVRPDIAADRVLLAEQGRAVETVRSWLGSVA